MSGNPSPAGTWKFLAPDHSSLGSLNKVFLQGILPILVSTVPFGGCRDKWHCLDKPEVTSLGSLSQCQCGQASGSSHALAVRCPQSLLPNP